MIVDMSCMRRKRRCLLSTLLSWWLNICTIIGILGMCVLRLLWIVRLALTPVHLLEASMVIFRVVGRPVDASALGRAVLRVSIGIFRVCV